MGTTNSKKLSISEINECSTLTPLQNAVLHKKCAEVKQLLPESDDVNGVSDYGLTLLHLAVVQSSTKQFMQDRYYEYLCENNPTQKEYKLIREIVELLCLRGARLSKDALDMNPLEALHYCSSDKSVSRELVNTLTSNVSLTCTDLLRYFVCRIVYHRCNKLGPQAHSLVRMNSCKLEGKNELFHSLLLFVKHGIEPVDIPGRLTSAFSDECMCFGFHDFPIGVKSGLTIDYGRSTFDFLEYKLCTWQRLWNLSDPLHYTFLAWIVGVIALNFEGSTTQREQSRDMLEMLITAWMQIPSHYYPRLSGQVMGILRHVLSFLLSVTKEIRWETLVDASKLNQLLYILVDIMCVTKPMDLSGGKKMGQLISYYIHKLLIKKYNGIHYLPYEDMAKLSKSISSLFTLSTNTLSYMDPLHDYSRFDPGLDKKEFLGFLALFDPDLNARNQISGRTPLHDALLFGNLYLIQTLIESGANPFTVDRDGNSFIEQLNNIIKSLRIGPARQVYEETRDQYIILNPPFPLFTLAANVIVRKKVPFDILTCQPRIHNMLLSYLPIEREI